MKIFKNYLYNLSYQIIAIILPLITIPYVSRILGADLIGVNSYTNTIISYFVLLANVGLTVYGNRTISYTRDSLEERSQKFWEIMVIKILMAMISYLCFFVFTLFYSQYRFFLYIQSIQILAVAIDISWFFTGLEDFKKTVTRNTLTKIFSALCVFFLVKSKDDLAKYILILTGSTLLGNLTLWTFIKTYVTSINFKKLNLYEHLKPVLILFIPQLATTLFMTLNKLLLGNLSTISQSGYFDNADKIVRILLTFITAVGTVIFPRLANSFKKENYEEVNSFLKLAFDSVNIIAFPMVTGVFIIGKPFSIIFFGENFKGIEIILSILAFELVFMAWSSVLGNQFLVATNRTKGLTISVLVATIILLLCSIILIPKFGASGAALTSVIGEAVIALVQMIYVKQVVNLKVLFSDIPKFLVCSFLMGVFCYFVGTFFVNNLLSVIVQVLIGGLSYATFIWICKPGLLSYGAKLFK